MTDIASDREVAASMFAEALEQLRAKDPDSEVVELWEQSTVEACSEEIMRRFRNSNFPFEQRKEKTIKARIFVGLYQAAQKALIWAEVREQHEVQAVEVVRTADDLLSQLTTATNKLAELDPRHELVELFRDRGQYQWFKPEIARRFRTRDTLFAQVSAEPSSFHYALMLVYMRYETRILQIQAS